MGCASSSTLSSVDQGEQRAAVCGADVAVDQGERASRTLSVDHSERASSSALSYVNQGERASSSAPAVCGELAAQTAPANLRTPLDVREHSLVLSHVISHTFREPLSA